MAVGASQIAPVVLGDRFGFERVGGLVTLRARNRYMAARESETRLFVACQSKSRRVIAIDCMATRTIIHVRRGGKLARVFVFMTVGALFKFDFEKCVFAFGNVTLRTLQLGVATLEWVFSLRVFC